MAVQADWDNWGKWVAGLRLDLTGDQAKIELAEWPTL